MSSTKEKLWSIPGLFLLAVLLVLAVLASNTLFKGMRIDLTENQLYTMTQGTRNVLANIEEPVSLYFYFSDSGSEQLGQVRSYAKRVLELLEEYEQNAKGKIKLHVIDPLPFSEEEDEATRGGVLANQLSTGDTIYFGLVATNTLDDQSVIPVFQSSKEAFLEYDLTKLIYSLTNPKKTVIGLMTPLPARGGLNPATGRPLQPWTIVDQVEQIFEVREVAVTTTSIDSDIDVLMIAHPKNLSTDTLYAIDQYMLGGGRALIFVDPHSDSDLPPNDPNNPAAQFQSRSSTLAPLFAAWGIDYSANHFVADNQLAIRVRGATGEEIRHIGFLGITEDGLSADDVVSGGLNSVNLGYAGSLDLVDTSPLTMEALITSSADSGLMDTQSLLFSQDPNELMDNFQADAKEHILSARFSGEVVSGFADRAESEGGLLSGNINAVVVADTDFLLDLFWVRVQNILGQRLMDPFASNGDFIFNALDNLTGSSDLISIRGRETYVRPFKRVEALKIQAEERFRQTEDRLQAELEAAEQRLSALQSVRTDQGSLMMTPEQQAEIDSFFEQKARIRKDLRDVRRNLARDIDGLGTRLKVVNTLLVPLLLTALVLFGWWRGRRRTQI
ncbi:MAG: Gldg family protein [Gammaproteobacteria bacterium]